MTGKRKGQNYDIPDVRTLLPVGDNERAGGVTAEAALALPAFLLCFFSLIYSLFLFSDQARQVVLLQQQAERTAQAVSFVAGSGVETIDLPFPVSREIPGLIPMRFRIACRARVRSWVGKKRPDGAGDADDALVYVTEHASVYHTESACTHLALSVSGIEANEIAMIKNEDGRRYHSCEKCIGKGAVHDYVFIGKRGDRFHNDRECSGLKRSIKIVKKKEAGTLVHCTRCAAMQRAKERRTG